jgi:sigma-B regulation protein RsbU (phosphoserine phosphatase)
MVPDDVAVSERLENLQSLTDSTIAHLDVDDLLVELLTRVRVILDVDTAAVLILDARAQELVARAAVGVEDEVRQGVRIPLGVGFAGRIAATKETLRLDHVDSTTVSNPILWERGIKAMLGVPLLRNDSVVGVLHVGRLEQRPFNEEDVELLHVVAERVSGAMARREHAIERAAALMLERGLQPPMRPRIPELDFATRYVVAEDRTVGGDWYDLFRLPSGELWVVVGDVAGHGLQAAVMMGRIRSSLRSYSLVDSSPARVLELVDRKLHHFEAGAYATLVCASIGPSYDTVTLAVAGHPPPVIAVPGRPAAFAEVEVGPPIGANLAPRPRLTTTIPLAAETVVAFYTDGLVERRGESIDRGLERLRQAIRPGHPDLVARDLMRHLIGGTVPRDDIALVVMRRTSAPTQG